MLNARWGLSALTLALCFSPGLTQAQETKKERAEEKAKAKDDVYERAEGVIVKIEAADESSKTRRYKVTVNTAAVWMDYVRDQANFSEKPDAKVGENSVATKGEPISDDQSITFFVGPNTNLSERYRSSTDETNNGSKTIEEAEKKDGAPAKDEPSDSDSKKKTKAPKIKLSDLKPGLFVSVEASKGHASRLIVLKPVGGADTPASEGKPKKKG